MPENYRDQNSPFRKFQPEKRVSKILGDLFRVKSVKNGQLYHFSNVRKSLEKQASKKFYNKCSENSRSQIVLRTDVFRKLTLGAPVKTHQCYIVMYFVFKRVINQFIILSYLLLFRQRFSSSHQRCTHSGTLGTLKFFLRAAGIFRVGQRPKLRAAEPLEKKLFSRVAL